MMSLHVAKTNDISIHAAREGGDRLNQRDVSPLRISIHAAREGGDIASSPLTSRDAVFQSTPPVKAATLRVQIVTGETDYFNPRRP